MVGAICNGGPVAPAPELEGLERPASASIWYITCPQCHHFLKHKSLRIRLTGGYQEYYGPTYAWIADCPTHGTVKPDGEWEGGDFL